LYRVCDDLSGALIYGMVVFAPWAFGTTQAWSIWTMNICSYLLGALLTVKLLLRRRTGYLPPRYDRPPEHGAKAPGSLASNAHLGSPQSGRPPVPRGVGDSANWQTGGPPHRGQNENRGTTAGVASLEGGSASPRLRFPKPEFFFWLLSSLTVLLVGYCFVSAVNARADFDPATYRFEYRDAVRWLPHSLDAARTWFWSWNYLALALAFWAVRDWLLGKTERELRASHSGFLFPARLGSLLWVLTVSGGLLAVEGIVQRIEGSGYLLFLVKPRVNPTAESQFGPYAYRGSAASYFNLVWPCCLGFWWTLHRYAATHRKRHQIILVCAALMAACPFISTSRGGALVTTALLVVGGLYLALSQFLLPGPQGQRRGRLKMVALLAGFCLAAAGLGYAIGWKRLQPRMAELREGFRVREEMFDNARPMARHYTVFGTGPGTFEMVFQYYRKSTDTYWPAQLHNDWLETRITFGLVGMSLILAALATVLLRWFARGGIHGGRRFTTMTWLALAGCLVHARYDFPFRIYSILFLFVVLCAMLFTLSRRPWRDE